MATVKQNLVTLLFPPRCVGCAKSLQVSAFHNHSYFANDQFQADDSFDLIDQLDRHWCVDCIRNVTRDQALKSCEQCGAYSSVVSPFPGRCALCNDVHLRFESTCSVGNYRGLLQELIVRMKNQRDEQLAFQLGYLLGNQLRQSNFFDQLDAIVTVPTHWRSRLIRGFHGSGLLGTAVARCCGLPHLSDVLKMSRSTRKQGTLSTAARFRNVKQAFQVRRDSEVAGKRIVIIDDVMTSGATMSEVARVLLRAGAGEVNAGVVARGAQVSNLR